MRTRSCRPVLATAAALLLAAPAWAYVDLAPTLATVVNASQTITVAEVDRFSAEKGVVLLKKVRDLKGDGGAEPIRQHVLRADESTVEPAILDWAEPGALRAVRLRQDDAGLHGAGLVSGQRGVGRLAATRRRPPRIAAGLLRHSFAAGQRRRPDARR